MPQKMEVDELHRQQTTSSFIPVRQEKNKYKSEVAVGTGSIKEYSCKLKK